jgi:prepilin-type N-terminal cleavage/methylation domain-containing protein
MRKRERGFSLIELLVVVAIIMVIVAIAIPNVVGTRMRANEASAASTLRTLNAACLTYQTVYNGYPETLANLGPASPPTAAAADLIDSALATGIKSGYNFIYSPGPRDATGRVNIYSIAAQPASPGSSGQLHFYTDQSGVIRSNTSGPADATSTPIG